MAECKIIGVLDNGMDGLSGAARSFIEGADLVIGARRTLDLFSGSFSSAAEILDLTGQLSAVPLWIEKARAENKKTVLLATGDPLCHGIGKYLVDKLGTENLEFLPNISTLQLGFSRLGLSWAEAKICSVHGPDTGEWIGGSPPGHGLYPLLKACRRHDLVGVYTSPHNTPDRIARMLLAEGLGDEFEMAVAERLLLPDEQVQGKIAIKDAAAREFSDPNVMVIRRIRPAAPDVLFGLPDDAYLQRKPEKGLITKLEARAVSLALMRLKAGSIVWDIGAGSGSVGLEAARLCREGHVYAIEKNLDDFEIARENRRRSGLSNHTLVHAKAPAGLDSWPDPDAVFIGGSGGELAELIRICLARLKKDGYLVMNFVTLENQSLALATLQELRAEWGLTQLFAARSKPILDMHRLAAENPVWIIHAGRGEE